MSIRYLCLALCLGACSSPAAPVATGADSPSGGGTPDRPDVPADVAASIAITGGTAPLAFGDVVQLHTSVQSARHTTMPDAVVTWSSDHPAVATVTPDGLVRSVSVGQSAITATSGSAVASIALSVVSLVTVDIAGPAPWIGSETLVVGATVPMTASVTMSTTHAPVPAPAVQWSSTDPSIATVSPTGVVRAIGVGTTTITASSGGAQSNPVTVTARAASIVLGPQGLWVAIGDSVRMTVTALTAQGSLSVDPAAAQWTSSNSNVIAVNSAGWAIGRGAAGGGGDAIVTASYAGAADFLGVAAASFAAGLPAGMRFVNATSGLGPLTFNSSKAGPLLLTEGEVRSIATGTGNFQITMSGFPASPEGTYFTQSQGLRDILPPNAHATIYASGDSRGAVVTTLWDDHGRIPGDSVLVRLMYGSNFTVTYAGNNLYFLNAEAPIDAHPYSCYIDTPGETTAYFSRPAGAYDIVLVNPGGFVPDPNVFGQELVRFHVTPTPGRATTYVLTGMTPATMRLVTVLDP